MTGIGPVTSALPRRCSTDWATSAYYFVYIIFLSCTHCQFVGCPLVNQPLQDLSMWSVLISKNVPSRLHPASPRRSASVPTEPHQHKGWTLFYYTGFKWFVNSFPQLWNFIIFVIFTISFDTISIFHYPQNRKGLRWKDWIVFFIQLVMCAKQILKICRS